MCNLKIVLSGICIVLTIGLFGQEQWSLEKCFQHAMDHNLDIYEARLNWEASQLNLKQNRNNRLPNMDGSTSYGWNFGRTIDPTTNSFKNETIASQGISVSAGMTLWNGGALSNAVRQSEFNEVASRKNLEYTKIDLLNIVAQTFLGVIVAEEQLNNARTTLRLSGEQLGQTDKLIEAGSLPKNDRLTLVAQMARDKQFVISMENNFERAYLDLKNLLNLEPGTDFTIEKPQISIPGTFDVTSFNFIDTYRNTEKNSPAFQSLEASRQSAELEVNIAKAGLLPTLSIGGNLSTNYADVAIRRAGDQTVWVSQDVRFNGAINTFEFETDVPIFEDYPYSDQLSDNFGQNVGFTLSVPILNGFRARNGVEKAKLDAIQTRISNDRIIQNTKNSIQTALANVRAAKEEYEVAQTALDASEAAYKNTERKYNLGSANTFEYSQSKNNFEIAKADMIRAKYNYFLQMRIIEWLNSDYSKPLDLFND